jgi:hypothetical protein
VPAAPAPTPGTEPVSIWSALRIRRGRRGETRLCGRSGVTSSNQPKVCCSAGVKRLSRSAISHLPRARPIRRATARPLARLLAVLASHAEWAMAAAAAEETETLQGGGAAAGPVANAGGSPGGDGASDHGSAVVGIWPNIRAHSTFSAFSHFLDKSKAAEQHGGPEIVVETSASRSPEASLGCPASIIPLSKCAALVDVRIESEHARVDRVICVDNATIKVQCDERVLDVTASSDVRGAAEIVEHCDDPFCAADTHAVATIIALLIDIVACAAR